MSSSNFQLKQALNLQRAVIRRELADAQAALAQAEDRDPEAVPDARRKVAEAIQRLRLFRFLERPRAAQRSIESRHVTEDERAQLRLELARILNNVDAEMQRLRALT